jgi:hypothetical protein
MAAFHEQIAAEAMAISEVAVGDYVRVVTRMGSDVCRGTVMRIFPYGAVQVRSFDLERGGREATIENIYDTDLYMLLPTPAPEVPDRALDVPVFTGELPVLVPVVGGEVLAVSDVGESYEKPVLYLDRGDWRVYPDGTRYHLSAVAFSDRIQEDEKQDIDEAKAAKKDDGKKASAKSADPRKDTRSTAAKVDVNLLPKDLQKRLRGVGELDDDARDRVLSAISDAAMRSFKAVGVRDAEIYNRVVLIQDAIKPVLGIAHGSDTKRD